MKDNERQSEEKEVTMATYPVRIYLWHPPRKPARWVRSGLSTMTDDQLEKLVEKRKPKAHAMKPSRKRRKPR